MKNSGLNGWFGKFLKATIVAIASIVDQQFSIYTGGASSLIGSFADLAQDIGEGGSTFWNRTSSRTIIDELMPLENDPRGNYEPTLNEQVLLNKFTKEFSLILSDLSQRAHNRIEGKVFSEIKLQQINEVLQRIAVVKNYYKNNEKAGLSIQALDLRNLIIETLVVPVEVLIKEEAIKDNITFKELVSVTHLAKTAVPETHPILLNTETYFVTKFNIFSIPLQIMDLPPKDDLIIIPNDPIDDVLLYEDVNDTENTLLPEFETQQLETTKKWSYKWILLGLAGFGIYKAVSK